MAETQTRTIKDIVQEVRQRPEDLNTIVESLRRDKAYVALSQVYKALGYPAAAAAYEAKQAKIDSKAEAETRKRERQGMKYGFKIFATGLRQNGFGGRKYYQEESRRARFLAEALIAAEKVGGYELRQEMAERAIRILVKSNDNSLYSTVRDVLKDAAPEAFKAAERHFDLLEKTRDITSLSQSLRV